MFIDSELGVVDALAPGSANEGTLEKLVAAAESQLAQLVRDYNPAGFACSFSAEDVVLLDLIHRRGLPVRVITLDTGRLPEETHKLIEAVRLRYGRPIRVMYPDAERLEAFTAAEGSNAFYRSAELRQQCCRLRKVEPLERALAGCRAWITGLRREQAVTRQTLAVLHWDETYELMKCNPLAAWTEADVWAYVRRRELPYNELYDRGYRSIGCAPCTRAVHPGEDARSGRWWWESPAQKECGLHVGPDGRLVRASRSAPAFTEQAVK
jgi:phosphoadenosine phosphosulfate reductase